MIPQYDWNKFIQQSFQEDIGSGDHTSLACIPEEAIGSAQLRVKESGVIAGVQLARMIAHYYDPQLQFNILIQDGSEITPGQVAFTISGSARSILSCERLMLNVMQRMSGVATLTSKFVAALANSNTKVLDTRKTTPLFRAAEKWAVIIGGGHNHRFGLYDMILIKDNHIDFAGGIKQAIQQAHNYLRKHKLDLKIEIETRNLDEVKEVLQYGAVHRIMLDNYTPEEIKKAVSLINNKYETEISGGVTLENINQYAHCGADFISVGAITHSYKSIDLSLKAEF